MKEELEIELVKKYPKILRDYKGDPMQTCLSFGMEHDEGWYNILNECMEKLQYFCDLASIGAKEGEDVQVVATQIKEKFGSLCFYNMVYGANSIENNIIDDIISEAERKSERTCEITGKHGEPCSKGGWYKTLCYEEARKLGYKACNQSTEDYWVSKDIKKQNGEDDDDET
jgi:hypothetical protein